MVSDSSFKILFFILIIVAVVLESFADILFKKYSLSSKSLFLIIGFIIYLIGTLFWAFSIKYEFLSKSISLFTVLNFIIVALAGVLYFNESLSLTNKIGIALGILSVILIEI